jgi:putative tricarboxylic transport membrane protein
MNVSPDRSAPPRPWWVGGAVIAIGALWIYGASLLPAKALYARIGPGLFVYLVGGALIALGALLLWQIARGERFDPQEVEDAAVDRPPSRPALLMMLVGAGLPLYTMERFGFALSAALVFACTARAFGARNPLLGLVIGASLGVAAWIGFDALGVELGPLWTLPEPLDLWPGGK